MQLNIKLYKYYIQTTRTASNRDVRGGFIYLLRECPLELRDDQNYTPLLCASCYNEPESVKLLLGENIDVMACEDQERSCIFLAATYEQEEVLKVGIGDVGGMLLNGGIMGDEIMYDWIRGGGNFQIGYYYFFNHLTLSSHNPNFFVHFTMNLDIVI